MTKENIQKTRKIYGICMAAYSGFVGLLFIIQVWSIFLSTPDNPYTVESITSAFNKIAVFAWLWVAAVIGGAFIPKAEPKKAKAYVSSQLQIERLQKRMTLDEEEQGAIKSMERFRFIMACITCIVWAVVLCVGVSLLTDSSYTPRFDVKFFKEHNALVDRIICFIPWLAVGTLVSIVSVIKIEKSRILQIVLLKKMLANRGKIEYIKQDDTTQNSCVFKKICNKLACLGQPKGVMITRIAIGVVGVVFVVFGIFNGGMADVLEKAVKICTQCIGLG